jgi:hypothetical protein
VTSLRLIVPALLLLLAAHRDRLARWQKALAGMLVVAWSAWLMLPIFREARWNLAAPRDWDFLCFWLWGRTAAVGVDFYDPAQTLAVGQSLEVGDEFSRLILHSGFWYPPPTILLFAPLGTLPVHTAMLVWYAVQGACAAAATLLLWRTFLKESHLLGLLVAGALLLAFPSARSTAWFTQTNFMLLLLFVLAMRAGSTPAAGVYVALGAIVKPYFLFLLGYLLLKKAYKAIALAVAVLALSVALCGALFGMQPLASFVASNPASRVPGYVVGELINQSLIGTIVRGTGATLHGSVLRQPLYLGIAMLLSSISIWIARRSRSDHALSLFLLLALLVYPATLAHYSLVILAPLMALWRDRREQPLGTAGVIALAVVVYAIVGWDRFESHNFWANAIMWGSVAAVSLYFSRAQASQAVAPARS